ALKGTDLEAIKSKKEALEKDAQALAVKAYEKAAKEQEQTESNETTEDTANGKTVDAEFEEK
ncbi:MAG: molecular chaperone DnaK, partial [Acholeplasmataceae bacterium]|nr:molecular chaperone DnaK [Acholeplasmataceae bacterium]